MALKVPSKLSELFETAKSKKWVPVVASLCVVVGIAMGAWLLTSTPEIDLFETKEEDAEVLGAEAEDEEKESEEVVSVVVDFGEENVQAYTVGWEEENTALDVLRKAADQNSFEVETEEFEGMGEFITSIDGQASDLEYFWGFYVDGEMATEGAGSYVVQPDESVEFVWTAME